MKMLKQWVIFCFTLVALISSNPGFSQTPGSETGMVEANGANQDIEMADKLRSDGKIYVVVGCVLVVLAGMIFYLITIDRKVSRLEQQYKSWLN